MNHGKEQAQEEQTQERTAMQAVFDKAWRGLQAQGFEQSMRPGSEDIEDFCAYRGEDGRRCAIGHAIPDDRYDPEVEGLPASACVNRGMLPDVFAAPIGSEAYHFLNSLQMAHDTSPNSPLMERKLRSVADAYRLTIPEEESA